MTLTSSAGVLHGRQPMSEAERRAGYSALHSVWAAAEQLNFMRGHGPPAPPDWAVRLRGWLPIGPLPPGFGVGDDVDEVSRRFEQLIAVVEEVSGVVYAELCRLWRARASVLDTWSARLYAPPVAVRAGTGRTDL
jgi:hypothetical protein